VILAKALGYFTPDGTAYTQNNPALKKLEMIVNFYDYQPCCASVLGLLAARGDSEALAVLRRLFENVRYYIGPGREKEGFTNSLRRSQLHLVIALERMRKTLPESDIRDWSDLLSRSCEDMLGHFLNLQERVPALDNRGFGTGINHVAIAAEGVYKSGTALNRPDWQEAAGAFTDRLIAYGHPDGYFEEHTNDAREGGPSLVYTPLTAGCAFLIQHGRKAIDRARFETCGAFFRNFMDTHLHAMPFADERANPHGLGCYGIAIHALAPEGRGLLKLYLDQVTLENMSLEYLARLHLEIDHMDTGPGTVPEPFQARQFRISMPLGVVHQDNWTMGLSAMKALNRELSPKSDYALDRQTLLFLSHPEAGTILSGTKSKHNPGWSTVVKGEDAYPVRTGSLELHTDRATATVHYETFSVKVSWLFGEEPRLVFESDTAETLTTQLVLEAPVGTAFTLDGERTVTFGEAAETLDDTTTVATKSWRITAGQPGRLIWYVAPFNPYSDGNKSTPNTRRPVFAVDWTTRAEFGFCACT
ncbi:MAG: hypothetical protein O3B73_18760, partial [bacterium]|nr:hypothetical protein [bacterium]